MRSSSWCIAVGLCALASCAVEEAEEVSETQQEVGARARGRDVWFNNTYGGEKFFTFLGSPAAGANRIQVGFDKVLTTPRSQRFTEWGVINDPDCVDGPAGSPDVCADPEATGVVGIRQFPGPDGTIQYGSTCASCHAGFDPLHPPADPNHPTWDNIHPTIGNQYAKFGKIFSANLAATDPRRFLLAGWPDGAVDTQLLFNDGIYNPGVVTAFWEWKHRPTFDVGADEPMMRNGQGGEDDLGPAIAAQRVYTNIGACYFECTLPAQQANRPIDVEACRQTCADYPPEEDLAALGKFLRSQKAPQYPGKVWDKKAYKRGRALFEANCASCHDNDGERRRVLSDDEVIALVDDPANATNNCRSKTNMWERGRLWAEFSSEVYKQRVEAGKRGYRNMPLAGIWATAPFTHNQGIGVYADADATPWERAAAYRTSMRELLQPSRTPEFSTIPVAIGPFPAGTPTSIVFSTNFTTGQLLCDDYVENKGHYYGSALSSSDKEALIYWLQFQ